MTSSALDAGIRSRRPPCQPEAAGLRWQPSDVPPQTLPLHYQHCDGRLGVDFQVHSLPFEGLQALEPRLIRIPPGACNEKHRHAHESLFVVLEGEAEILVGSVAIVLQRGGIAFAPRWIVHQTRNIDARRELLLLAVTDFGLTSSVLGNYDRQTRLRFQGQDACHDREPAAPSTPQIRSRFDGTLPTPATRAIRLSPAS